MTAALGPAAPGSVADAWESAYLRFESPAQEIRKFGGRLRGLGAGAWPRGTKVLELFCGRGNGLRALAGLGFWNVFGVDLSPTLVARSPARGQLVVADCRRLPFAAASREVAVVQGGLHHLMRLPEDLEETLAEVRRVLGRGGRLVVVEPWRTPFLSLVHRIVASPHARRVWKRLEALGTMIDLEGQTYVDWLNHPAEVLTCLRRGFDVEVCRRRWGKLLFVGRKR